MNTTLRVEDWLWNLLDKSGYNPDMCRSEMSLTFTSYLEVKAANPRRSATRNPAVRYLLSRHESRYDNRQYTPLSLYRHVAYTI